MEVRFRCKKCGSVYKGESSKIRSLNGYFKCKTCNENIYLLESVFAETPEKAIESFARLYLIDKTKEAKGTIYASYSKSDRYTLDDEIQQVKAFIGEVLRIRMKNNDWSWVIGEKSNLIDIYNLCDHHNLTHYKTKLMYFYDVKSFCDGMKLNGVEINSYQSILMAVDKVIQHDPIDSYTHILLESFSTSYIETCDDYGMALISVLCDYDGKGNFHFILRPYELDHLREFSDWISKIIKNRKLIESLDPFETQIDLENLHSALSSLISHLQVGLHTFSKTNVNIFSILTQFSVDILCNSENTNIYELEEELKSCLLELMVLESTLSEICLESDDCGSAPDGAERISGYQFEDDLCQLFRKLGFSVEKTPLSGDQGADLIVEKKGSRTVVQAKRYSGKVTNKAVQEIFAAKTFYNADRAIVVTNSVFTKSAIELAISSGVELWDGGKLEEIRSVVK